MSQLKLWAVRLSTACLLCLCLMSPVAAQNQAAPLAEAQRLNQQVEQLYQAGRYAAAIPLAERALTMMEKVLGPKHPSLASSLFMLAALYQAQGDPARALPLLQRALALVEQDESQLAEAEHLNQQAVQLYQAGRYAEALPLAKRALALWENALGPEHPDVATALYNLVGLYRVMGDYTRALTLLQRALVIWEKTLGPAHPKVANTLKDLALLHQDTGDYTRALTLYQRALGLTHNGTRDGASMAINDALRTNECK